MYKYIYQVGLDLAALGDRSSCDGGGGRRKGVLEEPVDLQYGLEFWGFRVLGINQRPGCDCTCWHNCLICKFGFGSWGLENL
jgi:hypothetical protein